MNDRCSGRYPMPQTAPPRDEPFEVSYRCALREGHDGPHGSDYVDWGSGELLAMVALDDYPIVNGLPKSTSVTFRIHLLGHAYQQLRSALVGLVGVNTRAELEQMEAFMRLMPAPAEDKAATIDAIHALLATMPIEP
jgi:hypothetical protein